VLPAMLGTHGGDWCETFALSGNRIALSIGDICGHGFTEFNLMVTVRRIIRDTALQGASPMGALAAANRFLCTYQLDKTASAILGFLDMNNQSFTFANAGHPSPLMANSKKTSFLDSSVADLLLGVDVRTKTKIRRIDIPDSTLLVLYTDGVSENKRNAIQGMDDLCNAVTSAYACIDFPKADIIAKSMNLTGSNADDVSILTAFISY
jgi:serine phosphatase RsbU (regulator of sigma subunit)